MKSPGSKTITVRVLSSFVNATQPEDYELEETATASDLVSRVLLRHKMLSRDPRLFYLTLDTVDTQSSDTPIANASPSSSVTLHDDSVILTLIESHDAAKTVLLVMHMRSGGLVKIYDACIMPGSYYKSLFISRKTTASNVIQLLLSSYALKESPEDFILTEKNTETKNTRDLQSDEYPLTVQQANPSIEIHLKRIGAIKRTSSIKSPEFVLQNYRKLKSSKARSSIGLARALTYHGDEDLSTKSPATMTRKDTLARLRDSFRELQRLRNTNLQEYERNVIRDTMKPELLTPRTKNRLYGTKARQERLHDLMSDKSNKNIIYEDSERISELGNTEIRKTSSFKRAGSFSARTVSDYKESIHREDKEDDGRRRLNSARDRTSKKLTDPDKPSDSDTERKADIESLKNNLIKSKSQIPRASTSSTSSTSSKRQLPQPPSLKDEDMKAKKIILEREAQRLLRSQKATPKAAEITSPREVVDNRPSPVPSVSSVSSYSSNRKAFVAEIKQKQQQSNDGNSLLKLKSPVEENKQKQLIKSPTVSPKQKHGNIVIKNFPGSVNSHNPNENSNRKKPQSDFQCQSFEEDWSPAQIRVAQSHPTLFEVIENCDVFTLSFTRQKKSQPWGIRCYESQFTTKDTKRGEEQNQYRIPAGRKPAIGKRPGAFGGNSKILKFMKTVIAIDSVSESSEVGMASSGALLELGDYILEINGTLVLHLSPDQIEHLLQTQMTVNILLARPKPYLSSKSSQGSNSSINGIDNSQHSKEVRPSELQSQLTHLKVKYDKLRNETAKNEHLIHELRALVVKKANVNLVRPSQKGPHVQTFQAIPLSHEEIISTV